MTAGFTKPSTTNSSATLEIHGVRDIGLNYFLMSTTSGLFLGRGVTSAIFQMVRRRCSAQEAFGISVMGQATRSQYSFSSQLGVLSGPQSFLGLRTSSALCTRCSVTLKISGESDSRGTRSRGAGSLYSSSALRRAALMALACSLKGSTENPSMLIWLAKLLWKVFRPHRRFVSSYHLFGFSPFRCWIFNSQYFLLQIFLCRLTGLRKYLN